MIQVCVDVVLALNLRLQWLQESRTPFTRNRLSSAISSDRLGLLKYYLMSSQISERH
jgi:hypothetical protein